MQTALSTGTDWRFRLAAGGFMLFWGLLPILADPGLLDRFLLPRATFLGLTLLWVALLLRRGFPLDLLAKCLLAWSIWTTLAVLWAPVASEAWFVAARSWQLFGLYLAVAEFLRISPTIVDWALRVLGLAGLIVLVQSAWQWGVVAGEFPDPKALYRVREAFGHRNLLSSALLLMIPVYGMLWRREKGWLHWSSLLGLFAALAMVLLLQSRSAWLALFGGLLALLSVKSWKSFRTGRGRLAVGLASIVVLGLLAALILLKMAPVNSRLAAVLHYQEQQNEHTETIRERLWLWKGSAKMAFDHPVLGVGPGQWKLQFPRYGLAGTRAEQGDILFQRPHNDYLWVWCETGWPGLVLFLLLMGIPLVAAFRKVDGWKIGKADWVALGLSGYVIVAFFDFPLERVFHPSLWALLAALACYDPARNEKGKGPVWLLLILIGLGTMALSAGRWSAERRLSEGLSVRAGYTTASGSKAELFARAMKPWYRMDPAATPIDWYLGEDHYLAGEIQAAHDYFLHSLALSPYHLHTLNNLGATSLALGKPDSALYYFDRAAAIAPGFTEMRLNRTAMAVQSGDWNEALRQISQAVPQPDNSRYRDYLAGVTEWLAVRRIAAIDHPAWREAWEDLAENRDWQLAIHQRSKEFGGSYRERADEELLDLLAADGRVAPAELQNWRRRVLSK